MLILKSVLGKVQEFALQGKNVEVVSLNWDEMGKKMMRKTTSAGREIGIAVATYLQHEDVLYTGEDTIIAIELLPTKSLVIEPSNMEEMALLCYHLGNRHSSVFYQEGRVITPYDDILGGILDRLGFAVSIEERRLSGALNTIRGHTHS